MPNFTTVQITKKSSLKLSLVVSQWSLRLGRRVLKGDLVDALIEALYKGQISPEDVYGPTATTAEN